jgi:hypothetical protein
MTVRPRRRAALALSLILTAAGLGPSGARPAQADDTITEILTSPLACRFQAVSVGQFRGLDYGPGVPSGTSVVMIAASPRDLREGRAAIIEQDRAAVARIIVTNKQALFVGTTPNSDTATLTLFFAARVGGGLPAALTRQTVIGNVPVLAQSTGVCRAEARER